jgi:hypothetical protein
VNRRAAAICLTLALAPASACSSGYRVDDSAFDDLMGIEVCDPGSGRFTTEIDNPYFPSPVGSQIVLEGGGWFSDLLVRITVLDETRTVAGVETRVVEEYEAEDGRVREISRNYFAQTREGTVCYFGEEVDIYDSDGKIVSNAGAWLADGATNVPGIFMPSSPEVGQAFPQEVAPGIAEDEATIVESGTVTEVPAGTFNDTLTIVDRNPLDGDQGAKVYARGVGLIIDGSTELTSVSMPGA